MKRILPVHPILLALSPIIFVYSYNVAKVPISPGELVTPIVLALVSTAVIWLGLSLVFRNVLKAALVTSLFVVLFFLFGHVAGALGPRRVRPEYLLIFWILIMAAGVWLVARRSSLVVRSLRGVTVFLNLFAGVVFVMNLVAVLPSFIVHRSSFIVHPSSTKDEMTKDGATAKPDIYYIILDAYARSDVLDSLYGADNSHFLHDLAGMGFCVPSRTHSNYSQTYLSMASSLNLNYLDSLGVNEGPESQNHAPLIRMIQQNRLVGFLKRHGYTIVSFASGYTGTDLENADVHYAPRWSLSEFQNVLLSTTPLPVLLSWLWHRSDDELHRELVLYSLHNIPNAVNAKHPVFVWAHIVCPHPPFVFGAHGELPKTPSYLGVDQTTTTQAISKADVRKWYVASYGPQASFLSAPVENMVRQILARSPNPPVIIIQGDHGPGSILNWDDPEREELPGRLSILDAIHLPPTSDETADARRRTPTETNGLRGSALVGGCIYDSITPVNTFRILLSRYFDTSMALLPDRSYFSTLQRPFRMYDIEHLETYPGPSGLGASDGELSVVAFPVSKRAPANPALYCRRLVSLKYKGQPEQIGSFYVHPVPGKMTVDQSFQLYRQLVNGRGLPEQGLDYDSYDSLGPEQDTVVALFFRAPSRGRVND